jgi:arginyl-tRNA--protein-N-Asp/Glu arginylyltransferase
MPTNILTPRGLTAAGLDSLLAAGWRPTGQLVYELDYIELDPGQLVNLIPTRLRLAGHRWSKRQRKLLRQNEDTFEVAIRPAFADAAKDDVYRLYAWAHPDKTQLWYDYHLRTESGHSFLNTWEVSVSYQGELVAFSFFDLGEKSAYGKMGVYNPAWEAHSLGLFTLFLEVDYCRQLGMDFYYPGYVSPDTPRFDYKHRLGALELWDLRQSAWVPEASMPPAEQDHIGRQRQALEALQALLSAQVWQSVAYQYFYSAYRLTEGNESLLDAPCFLAVQNYYPRHLLLVTYDLTHSTYRLWYVEKLPEVFSNTSEQVRWQHYPFLLLVHEPLGEGAAAAEMARMITQVAKRFENKTP